MNKQELQKKYQEIIMETNGNMEDYSLAICRIGTAINELEDTNDLQSQLDQQKARIEELEGQFAYECECNKQFVQLQNMWNELKEWVGDNIIENNNSIDPSSTEIEQLFIAGELANFEDIKNKMQELEQGETDDNC